MPIARARGAIVSLALGVALLAGVATPGAAIEPIDARDDVAASAPSPLRTPPPRVAPRRPEPRVARPSPSRPIRPSPTRTATPVPTPPPPLQHGLDVSWPQCGDVLPETFAFAIVGVNGGRVYTANPCLGDRGERDGQLAWAGRGVELYANTGNPGPRDGRHWPNGESLPRPCAERGPDAERGPGAERAPGVTDDTPECAYAYGWNAAADSYRTALEAFIASGWAEAAANELPWPTTWWLDVETANSWRRDPRLNVAALQGARDYLESMDVAGVGFYSTPLMWWRITGGTHAFADHPAWHAGANTYEEARRRCATEEAFTGGELAMVQWVEDGLDHDLRCS